MEIVLRNELPEDYPASERVTREAFWNHYAPGCAEHYLLHIMRDCPAFVPDLDMVAFYGNAVVGHIAYTKGTIIRDDGERQEVLTLGPISVLPAHQNQGIGGKLIEATKLAAQKMGFSAILLCGDPLYYERYGFVPAEKLGIRTAENQYAAALQVYVLAPEKMTACAGRYLEDEIYQLDLEKAEEYDKQFPPKEKRTDTPSQRRFLELVAMQRPAMQDV